MIKVFIFLCSLLLLLPLYSVSAEEDNGEMIAYSRLTDGYWQIWVKDIIGEKDFQLTETPVDKRYPDWTPDGHKLVYRTSNGNLFTLNRDKGNEHQILDKYENLINPKWSPDGKRLTFTRYRTSIKDDSDIWISDPEGKTPLLLTHKPGLQYQSSWSPDGGKIVYVSAIKTGNHQIFIMELKNKVSKALTDNNHYNILPVWSPDGNSIAFVSRKSGNYDIWIIGNQGNHLKQLTRYNGFDSSPAWAPDGKRIAFVSNRSGSLQIWIINIDTGNLKQLTIGESECLDPAWIRRAGSD